ncbi:MAG TPA: SpoIID/LytB domain-containing protein [Candidatus Acidoferrum sp.]|nr:SpoIID/LytB domain-containing protein [Candidatus Acidoferrum sp.]
MISRAAFLAIALAAGTSATPRPAAAQDQNDPAMNASTAQLRVLLGRGTVGPGPGDGFTFNGRRYRGVAAQLPDDSVVNTVSLEEYLYSVVPREMTPSWPAAALAAQAICARTYVLQRSNPQHAYDVVPSELDQVYEGIASETPAGRAAVDATSATVLRYRDSFARVAYSSCCGGHTESSIDAWGGVPIAYLNGVICTTCTDAPYYRWNRQIDLASVAQAFAVELQPVAPLQAIRSGTPDASGRSRDFVLHGAHGDVLIRGGTFRLRVGPRVLPSLLITKFEPSTEAPERIAIEGGGLGHGVGLCQWGARGRALEGASFSDILRFYFPGTEIEHD